MIQFFRRLAHQGSGATAIEYAIIASLIAGAIFLAVIPISTPLISAFSTAAAHL